MSAIPAGPDHSHQAEAPVIPAAAGNAAGTGTGAEYPQAIVEDYPGWAVRHHDGNWTAWCPAITVHATTPAALRAAIEHAITGDSPP